MYLKSLTIRNYRKFRDKFNELDFVSHKYSENKIASSTTLIVGKNNSGKTTITKSLMRIKSESSKVKGSDFNFAYLKGLLKDNNALDKERYKIPYIEFMISVLVEKNEENLLNNLAEFIEIGDVVDEDPNIEVKIRIKLGIKEEELFRNSLHKLISRYKLIFSGSHFSLVGKRTCKLCNYKEEINSLYCIREKITKNESMRFKKFLDLIDESEFTMKYFGVGKKDVEVKGFKLSNLLEIKVVNANNNLHEKNLSTIFNKIIKNRYLSDSEKGKLEELRSEIERVNNKITESVQTVHNPSVNEVLHQIEFHKRLGINLSAALDFDKLTRDLIKYEYNEMGFFIPEGQFGLGYTHLMNTIGEIIDYIDEYPDENIHNKINLICIEEPEAFMHPQMQECFIKYINNAVNYLLKESGKKINTQLVITTHSSHILNSKIHSSNSFNNINYIVSQIDYSHVVKLSDEILSAPNEASDNEKDKKRKSDDLKFLKKHIKHKVSELFFADAVIFVEGATEESLLTYYLEQNKKINKFYISILKVNGAHSLVYWPLLKHLGIPSLIITDIDIKRNDNEKHKKIITNEKVEEEIEIYTQINDLSGRETTNPTILKYGSGINDYIDDDNLFGVFQKDKINDYFATSFEEAFILENFDNDILNKALLETKPGIYKKIIGLEEHRENLKENSYFLQKKLSKSKSEFANELLYQWMIEDDSDKHPKFPQYIEDGLNHLSKKILSYLGIKE